MTQADPFKKFFDEVIIPKALTALETPSMVYDEDVSKMRSKMRVGTFKYNDEDYEVIEQNTLKTSRFGALARNGHTVMWVKSPNGTGDMYLCVDQRLRYMDEVTNDGKLLEESAAS